MVRNYFLQNNRENNHMVKVFKDKIEIYEKNNQLKHKKINTCKGNNVSKFLCYFDKTNYTKLIKTIKNYDEIYIGKDLLNENNYIRNGMSIALRKNDYIYIIMDNNIIKFRLSKKIKIKNYYTYNGNNLVLYCYLKCDDRIILTSEFVYIKKTKIDKNNPLYYYKLYYNKPEYFKKIKYQIIPILYK